jgi:hypothetical protein
VHDVIDFLLFANQDRKSWLEEDGEQVVITEKSALTSRNILLAMFYSMGNENTVEI